MQQKHYAKVGVGIIHRFVPNPFQPSWMCARLYITMGIYPRFSRKDDISRYDCPTERFIKTSNISTQLQDLGQGRVSAGRAKYPCFSRLVGTGLLLAFIGVGFGIPRASVEARAFSYLGDRVVKAAQRTEK